MKTNYRNNWIKTPFVIIDSGTYFSESFIRSFRDDPLVTIVDMYDLPHYDLSCANILIADGYVDQELMYTIHNKIRDFLNQGNILVFCGHLFRPWIPGSSLFVPKKITFHQDYHVRIHHPHPIFYGVKTDELTFNKGVAGFFARGHHPVPPGAEVLLTLSGGEPITYIDRHSTKGTILVHSGANLFCYANSTNTAGRIRQQLLSWLLEEHQHISQRSEVS